MGDRFEPFASPVPPTRGVLPDRRQLSPMSAVLPDRQQPSSMSAVLPDCREPGSMSAAPSAGAVCTGAPGEIAGRCRPRRR
jgi:hypothetical protein